VSEPYEEAAPAVALEADLDALASGVRAHLDFRLDPVPRVIDAEDWQHLKVGLAQRAKALNAFVADTYGARRIVKAGVIPARMIRTAARYEPSMRGAQPPGGLWVGVAALDLVRGPDGEFRVLADDVTTGGGLAHAAAAREALLRELEPPPHAAPRSHAELPRLLGETLRAASPADGEPRIAVLGAEADRLAALLGMPVVAPGDADVVYRPGVSDADVARLLGPATVGVVNALGCGVGDDRLTHAYVEDMVRFYVGEEPALRSVPTLDLGRPDHLERALDTFGELMIRPRAGDAEPPDAAALRAAPGDWVAQRPVERSQHPTLVDGALTPREVELRAFVFMHGADHPRVLPGGLTRCPDGVVKDTWVLA
jgi:carboxylate-amine ligase